MSALDPGPPPRTLAGIQCVRGCGRIAPIDIDEVSCTEGDPALLPVLIASRAWIADPDSDGVICPVCSTDAEFEAYYAQLDEAVAIIGQTMCDEGLDDEYGPPPGGRQTDAMMGIPPPDDDD